MKMFRLLLLSLISLLFMMSSINAVDLQTGNELYYSYDLSTISGSTVSDLANSNDGSCFNMSSGCNTVPGLLVNATDLDGVNDVVDTGFVLNSSELSIAGWLKAADYTPATTEFALSSLKSGGNAFLRFELLSSGYRFNWRTDTGITQASTVRTSFVDNTYAHFVITFDGANVRFYYNGTLDQTMADATPPRFTSGETLRIGCERTNPTFCLNGEIDEFGIWNKTLNQSEVSALYNSAAGFNPYPELITPTITNNITAFYPSSSISISLNTTSNVNMSYALLDNVSTDHVYLNRLDLDTVGKVGIAKSFDGLTDFVAFSDPLGSEDMTITTWIKRDDLTTTFKDIIAKDALGARKFNFAVESNKLKIDIVETGEVFCSLGGASGGVTQTLDTDFHQVSFTWNNTDFNVTLYQDGVNIGSKICGNVINNPAGNINIGRREFVGANAFFNGTIDEVIIFDRILNATEIQGIATTFNNFICSDCNSTVLQLQNLPDQLHQIILTSVDINGQKATITNFTTDTINPSLTVNIPSQINAVNINFNQFINFSDVNIDSCTVSISGETSTLCNVTNYVFTTFGNKTINVTATDLAGNFNSSLNNLLLVNPFQLFNFQLSNGTAITNFTFGGFNFINQANISLFNSVIVQGNNTLLFEKLGFASTNVSFVTNLSSQLNLTTNITDSKILIRIFDRETNTLLTGTTQITLQASIGFNGSTTTGLLNISNINFLDEQYQILAEHTGFSSETVFFNYNNQELINIDIFMLNSSAPDAGKIEIVVKNSLSQFVESATCSALEWRPSESAFVTVAQGLSNVNGETLLNIELNTKIYRFSCTKQTFTTITNAQIVQVDLSTLTIILNDIILIPTTLFPNLLTSLINTTLNVTHQLITYTFADSDGLTTEGCLQTFLVNGNRETFDSETCVFTPTGSIMVIVNINQTSDILLKGVLTTPEVIDFTTNTLLFKGKGDISFQLKNIGLDILIPTIFILLGLGFGMLLSSVNISVILMGVGAWMAAAFVPTVLSGSIAMFITVIIGLILYGVFSKK